MNLCECNAIINALVSEEGKDVDNMEYINHFVKVKCKLLQLIKKEIDKEIEDMGGLKKC